MTLLEGVLWAAWGLMTATLTANLWFLRRRVQPGSRASRPPVSVLIPARNEAANLRRLLPSLLAQDYPDVEVIVYDDGSDDETVAVVESFGHPRIRLLHGHGPPAGWIGKVHALYQATREATGGLYCFLDADTRLTRPDALSRLVARHQGLGGPRVLSGLPQFRGGGLLLVSAVPYALLVSIPLALVSRIRSGIMGVLNGQCWIISRELYHEHEPHRAHRGEVLEDVRIAQWLRRRGVVSYIADLRDDVEVWMYGSPAEAWEGFRKNAYLLLGGRPLLFFLWWSWFLLLFVLAPVLLNPWLLLPAWLTKAASDRATGLPVWVTLMAPAGFLLFSALQLDSARVHLTGTVRWKGRAVTDPAG